MDCKLECHCKKPFFKLTKNGLSNWLVVASNVASALESQMASQKPHNGLSGSEKLFYECQLHSSSSNGSQSVNPA